jgi:hypothetical protein
MVLTMLVILIFPPAVPTVPMAATTLAVIQVVAPLAVVPMVCEAILVMYWADVVLLSITSTKKAKAPLTLLILALKSYPVYTAPLIVVRASQSSVVPRAKLKADTVISVKTRAGLDPA